MNRLKSEIFSFFVHWVISSYGGWQTTPLNSIYLVSSLMCNNNRGKAKVPHSMQTSYFVHLSGLIWFHIRRIPIHITSSSFDLSLFSSISLYSVVLRDASSGWLLLSVLQAAGAWCTCAGPTGTQQWLRLKREERGGGAHITPHTGSRRPNPTRADTGAHSTYIQAN